MPLLDTDRLGAYMARVGYDGSLAPTIDTLFALHRAHLTAIPYENLDIHLGRTLTLDRQATFAKLVGEKRGGWCFEMNGTFGWVLEAIGFDVRYVAGAVNRADRGASALDNHLVLIVTIDRPYICRRQPTRTSCEQRSADDTSAMVSSCCVVRSCVK